MNGDQTLAAFLREVVSGMLRNDTDTASLDCTIPMNGQQVLITFDLTMTSVTPLPAKERANDC